MGFHAYLLLHAFGVHVSMWLVLQINKCMHVHEYAQHNHSYVVIAMDPMSTQIAILCLPIFELMTLW